MFRRLGRGNNDATFDIRFSGRRKSLTQQSDLRIDERKSVLRTRNLAVAAAIAVSLMTLSACSGIGEGAGPDQKSSASSTVKSLAAMLPADIRKAGVLQVGTSVDNPPIKFVNEDGKLTGLAIDQLDAASKVLGLRTEYQQGSFDTMVPGLDSNRFQAVSSIGDIAERYSQATFIDYLKAGVSWVTSPASKITLKSRDDLCGHTVALLRGSGAQDEMKAQSDSCVAAGKKEVSVVTYPDSNALLLGVSSGTDTLVMIDNTIGAYNVKLFPDKYKVVLSDYTNPLGVAFRPSDTKLIKAYQAAFKHLAKTGEFQKLATKWGLKKDIVTTFPINAGTSVNG